MHGKIAVFLVGFTSGIFFHSFFDFGYWFSVFTLFLGLMLVLFTWTSGFQVNLETRRPSAVFMIALLIFSLGVGLLRYDVSLLDNGDQILENAIGKQVILRGMVTEEPDTREENMRLTVAMQSIKEADGWRAVHTKALVTAPFFPEFQYGDTLELSGVLKRPENFSNENGREFDYVSYLAKDGIFYQMFLPRAALISSGNGNKIKEALFAVKRAFLLSLGRVIPEPESSLAGGLIVGAKRSLGSVLLDKFRTVGVIHIVVLSGYNITIVADGIMRVFSFLPRVLGMSVGALSVVLFAVMTGASATVVRASLMALLVILAKATGRVYEITIALFVAGFFMILHNPKILVFDPSFQLSFLATLGLIYLAPRIEKYFHIVPSVWSLREFAVATTATQIFVLPLLLYQTGQLSIVSLPVNLLILVFIPLTMLFGFLTGVIGFASTLLSMPFAFVSYALLWYELKVVEIFSSLPFASISIPSISAGVLFMWYAFYALLLYRNSNRALK
ncbi:MAG: ComEC family competence protein [Parcubacteria group bacterium]|nr:ComEC family competence protein [Parcubacteria group bacterium]